MLEPNERWINEWIDGWWWINDGLMKNELGGKIMTKFVGFRAKTYSYLIDDDSQDEKAKSTKKVCRIKKLNLKIIKTV